MSLKDNAYDQGADDALKNYIDELETMSALSEENGVDGGYQLALSDAIDLARNMRKDLYV